MSIWRKASINAPLRQRSGDEWRLFWCGCWPVVPSTISASSCFCRLEELGLLCTQEERPVQSGAGPFTLPAQCSAAKGHTGILSGIVLLTQTWFYCHFCYWKQTHGFSLEFCGISVMMCIPLSGFPVCPGKTLTLPPCTTVLTQSRSSLFIGLYYWVIMPMNIS